jgi:hypothetical protein
LRHGLPIAVLDAKYKDYWLARHDESPVHRISNEDIYQLFFYSQRLQARFGVCSPPPAFVLAPLPAKEERRGAIIDSRFTLVRWKAGAESDCSLTLILLPLTDILRYLAAGRPGDVAIALNRCLPFAFACAG